MKAAKTANLGVLFLVELAALAAAAYWGLTRGTAVDWLLGVLAPAVLAGLWALCGSPRARFRARGGVAGRLRSPLVRRGSRGAVRGRGVRVGARLRRGVPVEQGPRRRLGPVTGAPRPARRPREAEVWDETAKAWACVKGSYEITAGRSITDRGPAAPINV
ncbi:YrdB family protein [Streptomyces sp. NPDC040750]|uniref:YrdB family protein n=1 Tax=Streptomyces sp. NPDC040750 TaxID=3154491 RepID=UPI0033C7A382